MRGFIERVRRAFAEFLTIPTLTILAFLGAGALAYWLDQLRIARGWPTIVEGSHESITTLLGTIAGSIVTVTSITFSLLLIAVQQSAAALTGQVYDQFLRRRSNQAYFGFFVGLALYCMVILATVREDYTPVYGAALAFGMMVVALYMLILLIYSTVDQMRPVNIIGNIRDHTLAARKAQGKLFSSTKAQPSRLPGETRQVPASQSGFLTRIDIGKLDGIGNENGEPGEIVLLCCIGDYVSIGQPVLELRNFGQALDERTSDRLLGALTLERNRDLGSDAGFGIEQMTNIAWTTVSTSKQNPEPGKLVARALRDLMAHWYIVGEQVARGGQECRIVLRDRVPADLIKGFETLAVVASESMQHHTLAEVYRAVALSLRSVPAELHAEVEAMMMRSLSMLGDHALTADLDESIGAVLDALPTGATRAAVTKARDQLAATYGVLNSRASRVQNATG